MSTETQDTKADTKKRKDPPSEQGKEGKKKEKKQKKKKDPESESDDDSRTIWNESEEERIQPYSVMKNFCFAQFHAKAFSNSFGYEVEDTKDIRKRIDKWKEANKDKYHVSDIVEAVGLHPILRRPLTYFRVYYWDSSLPA